MKPTVCRCCGEKTEQSTGLLESNPNLCLACAEWDDATELLDRTNQTVVEIAAKPAKIPVAPAKRISKAA